jgi:hypothetical protein
LRSVKKQIDMKMWKRYSWLWFRKILPTLVLMVASVLISWSLSGGKCKGDTGSTADIPQLEGFEVVSTVPDTVPFQAGEYLLFSIRYGLIYAGDATLEIRNIAVIGGRESFHIVSTARTNKAFDLVFKVRDHHESFMDRENLFSLRFEQHLREGGFRRDAVVNFDQKNHLAIWKDKEVKIPPNTQDFLSALYYIRTIELKVGQAVALANHTGGKNYPIYIKVLRRESVEVPAGKFDCLVVEPVLETSTIFKHKGRLTIWLTDDNLKMPVLLRSKVVVGAFEASLKEYSIR